MRLEVQAVCGFAAVVPKWGAREYECLPRALFGCFYKASVSPEPQKRLPVVSLNDLLLQLPHVSHLAFLTEKALLGVIALGVIQSLINSSPPLALS